MMQLLSIDEDYNNVRLLQIHRFSICNKEKICSPLMSRTINARKRFMYLWFIQEHYNGLNSRCKFHGHRMELIFSIGIDSKLHSIHFIDI